MILQPFGEIADKSHFPVCSISLEIWSWLLYHEAETSLLHLFVFVPEIVSWILKKKKVLCHRIGLRMEWDHVGGGMSLSWNAGKSAANGLFIIFICTRKTPGVLFHVLNCPTPQHPLLVHPWQTFPPAATGPFLCFCLHWPTQAAPLQHCLQQQKHQGHQQVLHKECSPESNIQWEKMQMGGWRAVTCELEPLQIHWPTTPGMTTTSSTYVPLQKTDHCSLTGTKIRVLYLTACLFWHEFVYQFWG